MTEEESQVGYWFAMPHGDDDCLDARTYEIVYVYFDGKWQVIRPGLVGSESLERWNLLRKIGTPYEH